MEKHSILKRISARIRKMFGRTKPVEKVEEVKPVKKDELYIQLAEGKNISYIGISDGAFEKVIEWFHHGDSPTYRFYHSKGVAIIPRDFIIAIEYYPADMTAFVLQETENNNKKE